MKLVAAVVAKLYSGMISKKLNRMAKYLYEVENKNSILQLQDVEISSQDIEGWLVASSDKITVALDITINEDLEKRRRSKRVSEPYSKP